MNLEKELESLEFDDEIQKLEQMANSNVPIELADWLGKVKQLYPPFTYFGGKRKSASLVWEYFGSDLDNYIEPFAGGLAVLLGRPLTSLKELEGKREAINDTNLYLLNFWRTLKTPEGAAFLIDDCEKMGSHEQELLIRRASMLEQQQHLDHLLKKPDAYDPAIAAHWFYAMRHWIGAGADDLNLYPEKKKLRAIPTRPPNGIAHQEYLTWLHLRLKNVHAAVGDWESTVESDSQTTLNGVTGVFLDPPYIDTADTYSFIDKTAAGKSRSWAIKHGNNPKMRIAYCGYSVHHEEFFSEEHPDWTSVKWQEQNGYTTSENGKNREIDIIWFSPHCRRPPAQ